MTSNDSEKFCYAAITWAGIKFAHENQDAILIDGSVYQEDDRIREGVMAVDGLRRLAISDGAAGHRRAALGSRVLLELLHQIDTAYPGAPPSRRASLLQEAASDYVVNHHSMRDASATLVTVEFTPERTTLWHVGDSLAYLICEQGFVPLLEAHTAVNRMRREGELSSEEAAYLDGTTLYGGPDQMYIFSGLADAPDIQAVPIELKPGQTLLLASDGLNEHIDCAELSSLLGTGQSVRHMLDTLLETVASRGAEDNLSLIVIARA